MSAESPSPLTAPATLAPPIFLQPRDMQEHNRAVLNGEYDVPGVEFATPPVVLDIGACCGAFAVWAAQRWPGAAITCYEPNPFAWGYLYYNTRDIAAVVRVAVGSESRKAALYQGLHNLGEASLKNIGEQDVTGALFVDVLSAAALPYRCDILKVDTEGSEVEIIQAYLRTPEFPRPRVIAIEYHARTDLETLEDFLAAPEHGGYAFYRHSPLTRERNRGIAIWTLPEGAHRG